MKFGSIFVNYPSNASLNPNGGANTGQIQIGVNTHEPTRVTGTSHDLPPIEEFSNQCRVAQHALSGYMLLCSPVNYTQHGAVSEGRAFFLKQLEGLAEPHRPPTHRPDPEASDEQFLPKFLREMGYRFFDQVSECINRIRYTPPWLSNSEGTVFLNPELARHMNHHLAALRTIDAMVTPFRSDGQANTLPPRLNNKRAKFLRDAFANAHTQTLPSDQSHIDTQTSVAPQKETQTAAPVATVVASCAAQTMDVNLPVDSMQTEITSEFFSRDAAIQTKQFVDSAVAPEPPIIDAETQTDSDIDKGWDALQGMVKEIVADVMAYTSGRPLPAFWQEPDAVPRDLDMQFMLMFDVFNLRCGKVKSPNDKEDLLRTVECYFLPCMEQAKTARIKLSDSLVMKQFSVQEQGMKTAIEDIIRILGNALELGATCIEWLEEFAREESQESKASKAIREGHHAFTSSGEVLPNVAGESSVARNPDRSFDLNIIESAVDEIASTLPQTTKNKE